MSLGENGGMVRRILPGRCGEPQFGWQVEGVDPGSGCSKSQWRRLFGSA
jgi:hypothetical protein